MDKQQIQYILYLFNGIFIFMTESQYNWYHVIAL